ncbi:MAG: aldo/keto reductase, partial [Flavicella sp.]
IFLPNPASKLLQELANYYNVGVDAIALRYCMDALKSDIVLSGAFSKEQLLQNLKANEFRLADNEIELLSEYCVPEDDYWSQRTKMSWH